MSDLLDSSNYTSPAEPGVVQPPPYLRSDLLHELMVRGMFCSAMIALLTWDILVTIHAEVQMYRRCRCKWALTPAFLVARYAAPTSVALHITVIRRETWTSTACFHTSRAAIFLGTLVSSAATCLFGLRTWSMWHGSRVVLGIVVVLFIAQLALNLLNSTWLHPYVGPDGFCVLRMPHHDALWMPYVINMGVTGCLVGLVAAYQLMNRHTRVVFTGPPMHQLQMRLMHDGVVYFAITFMVNLLDVIFFFSSGMSAWADINTTLATTITSICASKLVLHVLTSDSNWPNLFGHAGSAPASDIGYASGPCLSADTEREPLDPLPAALTMPLLPYKAGTRTIHSIYRDHPSLPIALLPKTPTPKVDPTESQPSSLA